MNISKFFKFGICFVALALSACQIEAPYEEISGVDKSKAKPMNVTLDVDNLSSTGISIYWDGAEAVQAGAVTFTAQLVTEADAPGDTYNSTLSITSKAVDEVGNIVDAASFNKLTKGNRYFVRVRANYPYSVFSEWSYLCKEEIPVQYGVGFGFVYPKFAAPAEFKAIAATYGSINASWAVVGPATGYEVSYKESTAAEWITLPETEETSIKIEGLTESTSYDVRVRAFTLDEETNNKDYSDYSTLNGVETPVKPEFDPEIRDAEQFKRFIEEIAAQSGSADKYTLMNDIDLEGESIATAENFFGEFDGKGFKIKNAVFYASSLFAKNEGTIKNLVIDSNCSATAADGVWGIIVGSNLGVIDNCVNKAPITIENYNTAVQIGAIAGQTAGVVSNCVNEGAITFDGSTVASNGLIGGVVGAMGGNAGEELVVNCTNNGAISIQNSAKNKNTYLGGVLGGTAVTKFNGGKPVNNGTIKGCTNNGTIYYKWNENDSGSYTNVGGVVGYVEGDVISCTNNGNVTMSSASGSNAASSTRPGLGGVAGFVLYDIKDCINNGDITMAGCFSGGTQGAAGTGGYHYPSFGGIVAVVGGDTKYGPKTDDYVVSGCINNGTLRTEFFQKTGGGTYSAVGGIVGLSNTPIKNCTNNGKLEFAHGAKTQRMGGIVGANYKNITGCTNTGSLTFDAKGGSDYRDATGAAAYQNYVGGITGYFYAATTIENCVNEKTATIKYINGWDSAVLNYIGGISGSYSASQEMNNCHNHANVIVESTLGVCLCVGGVAGAFNGDMNGCTTEGTVSVSTGKPAAGKEHEVGGLIGYCNANVINCAVKSTVTNNVSGTFAGGLLGGFGETSSRQVSGCTVEATVNGAATLGGLLGQFRKAGSHTLWYNGTTISGQAADLPLCGNPRGNSVKEGSPS